MDRLDEESADLDFLEENLKNTEALTEKMTSMLNIFDDRLVRLEASILPIHKSTLTLTKLAENIDRTRNGVLEIIGYFDLVEREEMMIKRGPNENDLESYLNSIGKCKKAIEVLSGMRLKSSEKVIGQLKQLLKAAILKLEDLFRSWLTNRSNSIEPLSYITKNLDIPGIPQGPLQNLATLSSYLSSFGPEIGYNSDFVKVYIEVRSTYLTKSLKTLAQGSISTAEKRSTPVYEKGTCGFNSYTDAILKMFKTEYEIAEKILPSESVMPGYRDTIQIPLDNYVETGRTLTNRIKKNMQTDVFLAFDMMESLNKNVGSFEEVFRLAGKKDSAYNELLYSLRAVALCSFPEFIDEIKNNRAKTMNIPSDGTIHELTITTLQHLKRLTDYQETVETMLLTLGDGNWNSSEKDANFSRDKTGRGVSGNVVIQHYFADVLESLSNTLDSRSKSYKKTALTCIFLLNNYHHILKSVRSQFYSVLDPDIERKYEKMVKKYNDGYQDTWKPCFSNLMDTTWVRGGSALKALGSNEKSIVKENFKNFNTEFEETYKVHKSYAIPDPDLRIQVIKDIKIVLMPVYNRFLEKYQQTEFSKNPTKYIRYDPQTLENMVNRLFDGSIY
ncbi:Exo70 exocyst complex subunit [Rhizophagus irregularis]|uniref:Exocyst complex protein EXO70 n=1 Tax=Rhizophagus irregularis TaxID=588596 RepID=A0A2N0RWJ1_9GLOM|nr:Exo70 exocyst complex subunit [Rhizophagus irregularis]